MSGEIEGLGTMTLKGLAKATQIQEWRIRELVKNGKGPPHFRVGITYRFPIQSARQWISEQVNANKEE